MDTTDFIAAYAALVATGALLWNIIRITRRVKLTVATRWRPFDETLTNGYLSGIGLRLTNNGQFPIKIEVAGVYYTATGCWGFGQNSIIDPGMSDVFWLHDEIIEELRDNKKSRRAKYGYVQDIGNKKYKIKIPNKVLREWVRD